MNVWLRRARDAALAIALVAAPSTSRADDPPRVIVVVAPDDDRLAGVVGERVREAHATPELQRVDAIDPAVLISPPRDLPRALAHVWIDFTHADRAVLLLLDERMDRGLLRYASRAQGDEIAREELGHVLETAIEGLMEGATIGVARAELFGEEGPRPRREPRRLPARARSSGPPPPTPPSASSWRVRSSALYAVDFFGASTASHGPGLALDVTRPFGAWSAGLRALGQVRFPAFVTAAPFTLRLEAWATRLTFLSSVSLSSAFEIQGELGGGLDLVRVEPLSATGGASIAGPSVHAFPIVRVGLGVALRDPHIALRITADVDPAERYVFGRDGVDVGLFSANVLRPGVALEIGTP